MVAHPLLAAARVCCKERLAEPVACTYGVQAAAAPAGASLLVPLFSPKRYTARGIGNPWEPCRCRFLAAMHHAARREQPCLVVGESAVWYARGWMFPHIRQLPKRVLSLGAGAA